MINQGSKVTSEKLPVLFCSAWSLPPNYKIFRDKGVTLRTVEVPKAKLQELFFPILLKNIKSSNAHNF